MGDNFLQARVSHHALTEKMRRPPRRAQARNPCSCSTLIPEQQGLIAMSKSSPAIVMALIAVGSLLLGPTSAAAQSSGGNSGGGASSSPTAPRSPSPAPGGVAPPSTLTSPGQPSQPGAVAPTVLSPLNNPQNIVPRGAPQNPAAPLPAPGVPYDPQRDVDSRTDRPSPGSVPPAPRSNLTVPSSPGSAGGRSTAGGAAVSSAPKPTNAELLRECVAAWDPGTHMSRERFGEVCKEQERRNELTPAVKGAKP